LFFKLAALKYRSREFKEVINMEAKDLEAILNGKMPEGGMLVRTTNGSQSVELYGTNGKGFKIPVNEIDGFTSELKQMGEDPNTLYTLESGEHQVTIPGSKVSKASLYLKQARDIGVKLAEYKQFF